METQSHSVGSARQRVREVVRRSAVSEAPCAVHGAYALRALLDEGALARRLHRAPSTLERWRVRGEGPVFLRIGKLVRSSTIDVEDWLRREPGC